MRKLETGELLSVGNGLGDRYLLVVKQLINIFFFLTFKLGPFQIHSQLKESIHLSIHMPTGNPIVKEKLYCLVTLDRLTIWVARIYVGLQEKQAI